MSVIPASLDDCADDCELVADIGCAQNFLDRFDDCPGCFTFQVFDERDGVTFPQVFNGSFEEHRDSLVALNTQGTAGVFVTINRTDLKGRRAENITGVRAYFVDLDNPDQVHIQSVREGPLEPHLLVQSSKGGKGHAYWLVEGAPMETFEAVQIHLINRFHGDPRITDIGRVMRLPGFFHHKGSPVRTTVIHDGCMRPYSYNEILEGFGIDPSLKSDTVPKLGLENDKLLQHLQDKGLYQEPISGRLGGHKVLCPWRREHTTGDKGTAYFEANTNGYAGAGFVCQHAHCEGRGINDLRQFLGVATTSTSQSRQTGAQSDDSGSKPQLYVKGGDLPQLLDQAEIALLMGDTHIYQRDGMLVRMVPKRRLVNIVDVRRPDGLIAIEPVQLHNLVEVLTREAEWYRPDARGKEGNKWKKSDCPERHAKSYLSRGVWKLPVLQGVITAPTLRADGSVLDAKGYDAATGLFFHSNLKFPPLPLELTIDDAVNAVKVLKVLLRGFPFVDGASLSVAIGAILTALVRRSLPTAPLHAFNAPKRGSGKSLLADVVGMIATGLKPTQMSQPENQAEERKRLLALLMAGDPVICIDNVERPLGSDALCTILTSDTWSERLLGVNKNIDVSTNTLFLATGNNIVFEGDLTRRVLKSTIDPQCERPEERPFDVNLHHSVLENRVKLVHAGLTILLAYDCAGRPSQGLAPLGSYEEWSDRIRSPLVWCGLDDPCQTQRSIEAEDPVSGSLRRLLTVWYSEFKGPMLARDVLKSANENHLELRDAVEEFVGDPMHIGTRKFGARLQKYKNRTEGGLRLVQRGTNQGAVLWQVESAAEQGSCS
ncbi:hypothetical protein SCG7086_AW_00200 [Chlamydiales bacterium SCGC AG-110-P3]|nr:hypothetical protein SCG7086_AW_00200 [Chlamydiales bacterium SCGC AG-110-P3]